MKKVYLILFLCAGAFSAAYALNGTERSARFERATPPSETTAAGMTGDRNDNSTTGGSLRGAGNIAEPGPIGSGLGILMLCTGAYLFNSKKNRK